MTIASLIYLNSLTTTGRLNRQACKVILKSSRLFKHENNTTADDKQIISEIKNIPMVKQHIKTLLAMASF